MVKRVLTDTGHPGPLRDLGLLVLRVAFSASLIGAHGWRKMVTLVEGGGAGFPDPFGVGGVASLVLAVFAEVICGLALILGLGGRLPAVVLSVFFLVAFFMIHGGDAFGERELAFVYLVVFTAMAFTGPGRYSLGKLIRRK
jgi:putative oxidoreductase